MNTQPKSNVPTDEQRDQAIKQAKWDTKIQTFEHQVSSEIRRYTEELAKFKAEVAESEDMYYTLQWNAGPAAKAAQLLRLWATVEADYQNHKDNEKVGPVEVLQHHVTQVERSMLQNFVIEQSTNQVHNALSQSKAEAFARFHERATALIEFLQSDDS